jgi:hypothetical protein
MRSKADVKFARQSSSTYRASLMGAERYRWLNTSLFVAKGRLLGTGSFEYAVYRIT